MHIERSPVSEVEFRQVLTCQKMSVNPFLKFTYFHHKLCANTIIAAVTNVISACSMGRRLTQFSSHSSALISPFILLIHLIEKFKWERYFVCCLQTFVKVDIQLDSSQFKGPFLRCAGITNAKNTLSSRWWINFIILFPFPLTARKRFRGSCASWHSPHFPDTICWNQLK